MLIIHWGEIAMLQCAHNVHVHRLDVTAHFSAHLVTVGGVTPDHLTQILLDLWPVVPNLHNLRGH